MMRKSVQLVAILFAYGCDDSVKDAEHRYAIVSNIESASKLCLEGQKLLDAYLKAGDAQRYQQRKTEVAIDCQSRELDEASGIYRGSDGVGRPVKADVLSDR